LNIVFFLLKKNGIAARIPRDEMPTIEEEVAVPYTEEELKRLFAEMGRGSDDPLQVFPRYGMPRQGSYFCRLERH
jgi:hypothetical protein